jgi:hypothetical protein
VVAGEVGENAVHVDEETRHLSALRFVFNLQSPFSRRPYRRKTLSKRPICSVTILIASSFVTARQLKLPPIVGPYPGSRQVRPATRQWQSRKNLTWPVSDEAILQLGEERASACRVWLAWKQLGATDGLETIQYWPARLPADKRSMGNPGARTSSSWMPVIN